MIALLTVGLLSGFHQAPAAPPAPVAIVLVCKGSSTWSDGKSAARELKIHDRLRPGETVKAGPDATVTIYYLKDGHQEILKASASVVVGAEKGAAKGDVLSIESKLKGDAKEVLGEGIQFGKIGGISIRGPAPVGPVMAPLDRAIVATDQPTFRWPPLKDAATYRITVSSGGTNKTVWTREIAGTELKYPTDAKALPRELVYKWEVIAIYANKNEKLLWKGRSFTVGSEEMAKQAKIWQTLAESKDPADLVLAAIGFEQLQMKDELYPLYAKLTKAIPDNAKLWSLHAFFAGEAGLEQEAKEAWEKAKKLGWKPEP